MQRLLSPGIFLIVFSITCFSQEESEKRFPNWDFSLSTGGIIGGPCNPMRESILHYGIDNEVEMRAKNYLPLVFEANLRIKRYFGLGINTKMLHQDMERVDYNIVEYHFNTIVINPFISFNYKNFLFIGAGPALNAILYSHTYQSAHDGRDFFKAGLIVKSSVEYPKDTRMFLLFEMQYNYGSVIDPYYTIVGVGLSQTATRSIQLEFPVNYFYAGAGIGVRIFSKRNGSKIPGKT